MNSSVCSMSHKTQSNLNPMSQDQHASHFESHHGWKVLSAPCHIKYNQIYIPNHQLIIFHTLRWLTTNVLVSIRPLSKSGAVPGDPILSFSHVFLPTRLPPPLTGNPGSASVIGRIRYPLPNDWPYFIEYKLWHPSDLLAKVVLRYSSELLEFWFKSQHSWGILNFFLTISSANYQLAITFN